MHNHSYENEFNLHVNEISLSYERMSTRTRFEKEAKGNSEWPIGFVSTMVRDWFKKFAPLFHPIKSKTKTNRDSLTPIFPRFVSATCNYFEF